MRVTASRRHLLTAGCGYWAREGVPWDETPTKGKSEGTEMHEGAEAAHNEVEIDLSARARRKVDGLGPLIASLRSQGDTYAEISFAWNPQTDTARVLGVGKGREVYALAEPGEVAGTADLVLVRRDGSVLVVDHKSAAPGQYVDAEPQLRTLGLFSARVFDAHVAETLTLLVGEDGAREAPGPTLGMMALDAEAETFREELSRVEDDPHPHPGPWCKRCPAAPQCPATVDALAETLPAAALTRYRLSPIVESPEHADWMLTTIELVETALPVLRARLKEYADEAGGIVRADGSVYAAQEITSQKPALDVPGALAAVLAAGGEGAVDHTTTWAALGRAIGKKEAASLREKLAKMGAVKTQHAKRYENRKKRKEAA